MVQRSYLLFRSAWIVFLLIIGVTSAVLLNRVWAQTSTAVHGTVVNETGPVENAHVRVRNTDNFTLSNSLGQFTLHGLEVGKKIEITAWQDGYYIASTYVTPTLATEVTLTLRAYHTVDHLDYEWLDPTPLTSENACGNCHPMILPQWSTNAHGQAISNPRFFSLYNGTNLSGTVQIGPGYVFDFPGTDGVCASCHAPGFGVDGYMRTNMNDVTGVITAGIHCDFCHKIGGVYLDPATGMPYHNVPGVESIQMLRPPTGEQIFFGPYDDIHDPDTYLPEISESQFCAPCHQFNFWGTPIYESFNEWLASPYADMNITCQDCHMPPNGDTFYALPEVGGLEHPPETIPSHLQLGAASQILLENTVSMELTAVQSGAFMTVTVTISNTEAGHHVPTDFPGRHMILTVTAEDTGRTLLPLVSGPVVPGWGGDQSGLPGTAYAKVLQDIVSGETPVVSYWKQTAIVSDNRIPALESDTTHYVFEITNTSPVYISAQLLFRRVFQELADEKEWQSPDRVMETISVVFFPSIEPSCYFPLIIK